jgi:hypothetical protein
MNKEIKKLIKAIGDDYERWTLLSHAANDWSHPAEPKIQEFRDAIEVKEGSKYIKITTEKSVWGFVNKGNKDFKVGDILKAAGWRAPALNRSRGNIFGKYSVAWTGPHYIAGYSAGGERAQGLLRGRSLPVDGSTS